MNRRPTTLPRTRHQLAALCLLLAPAGLGCKGDDAKPTPEESAAKDAAAGTKDGAVEVADGLGKIAATVVDTAADGMVPAPALARGEVLAHFMIPNPGVFIKELREQAAPKSAEAFLDESLIKTFVGGTMLGSEILMPLRFDKPVACALVDVPGVDYAGACLFGYDGGAKKFVGYLKDVETVADTKGHVSHLKVSGEDVYLDDMDGFIVVTNHPDTLGKSKEYLQGTLIDRAPTTVSDIELVGYASALMKRYESELAPFISELGKTPFSEGSSSIETALAEYSLESNKKTVERVKEMKQMTLGLGLEADGFVSRWAVFPEAGTAFETELKAASAGPVDTAFAGKLPASSWSALAFRFDSKVTENELLVRFKETLVGEYAKEVGRDPTEVRASLDAFLGDEAKLYKSEFALAFAHEPGTLGAVVFAVPLEGDSGREGWKKWSSLFTPQTVLGEEGSKKVKWAFAPDASKVGSVGVDRWQISPTEEVIAELESDSADWLPGLQAKWPDLTLTIDRVEVDGNAFFILSPTHADKYLDATVKAAQGTASLGSTAGFKKITKRAPKVSMLWGLDAKAMLDWLRDIAPPEALSDIPRGVGNDLSDVFVVGSYGRSGTQAGEFVVSQPFIEQLVTLAE